MNTYVHFNDIFNITTPTVMEQRINQAFGTDGTNFWQNFFFCDEVHKNDRIIYLFTEYQLEFLWNWWNEKNRTSNINIWKNLDYSRQKKFNTLAPNGKLMDRICVGYVNSHEPQFRIQRVFFRVPPNKIMKTQYGDFFAGRFRGEPSDNTLTDGKCREQILRLVKMKREIERKFGPLINDEKWLLYLGPKYVELRCIAYCTSLNNNCPFAKKFDKTG